VFKGRDHLAVGDSISFEVEILPPNQDPLAVPSGDFFYLWDDDHMSEVKYLEAFLEGAPPRCRIVLSECVVIEHPTKKPILKASHLQYALASLRWKLGLPRFLKSI
jgi:hypothetical protein